MDISLLLEFREYSIQRIQIKAVTDKRRYVTMIELGADAAGYGVFSVGDTPEISLLRALESLEHASRYRKLRF